MRHLTLIEAPSHPQDGAMLAKMVLEKHHNQTGCKKVDNESLHLTHRTVSLENAHPVPLPLEDHS